MFYAQFVLAKKGPLARIWLAAHWDKKLTKAHVFETNIEKSVEGILQPKVKMALRTSGHLLLGVVRIYSRKAKYLLADCNEAFVKIKMAFRPGMVDLPEEHGVAAVNAITLPEVFHDFDSAMPELNAVDIEAQFSLNQSRAEEITMREEYGNIAALVPQEEGFGDMGFDTDTPELLRQSGFDHNLDQDNLLFSDGVEHMEKGKDEPQPSTSGGGLMSRGGLDIDTPIRDDGFGGNLGQDIIAGGLFEGGLFDDAPMGEVPPVESSSVVGGADQVLDGMPPAAESDDDDDHFGGPPSIGGHSSDGISRAASPVPDIDIADKEHTEAAPATAAGPLPTGAEAAEAAYVEPQDEDNKDDVQHPDQTTLLHNEEESFALAPVDASAFKGFTKTKRKRKLIVDEVKNISGEEMKAQLSDTTDIVTTLDLAPPTKRLMHWKETGGVEKLFALPGRHIPARALFKNYQRHLTSRVVPNDDNGLQADGDKDQLNLEPHEQFEQPAAEPPRRGRKRKEMEPEEPVVEPPPPATPGVAAPATPAPETPAPPQTPAPHLPPDTPAAPLEENQFMENMGYDQTLAAQNEELGLLAAKEQQDRQDPFDQAVANKPEQQAAVEGLEGAETTSAAAAAPGTPAAPQTPAPVIPPILDPQTPAAVLPPQTPAGQNQFMENMGYDQENPLMANMGYDEHHPPAMTPGAISEKGNATPWNEDYELPVSVGPPEEQATDETFEQFEERVLNKRAAQFYHLVKTKMQTMDAPKLYLSDLTHRNNRKQVAQKFYSSLVLKKFQVLELYQESSYAEIELQRGELFDTPTL